MSEVAQKAMKAAIPLHGRSFVIVTEDEKKGIEYHPRQNQPCWGELRKYEKSHPTRCTQPSVHKPGDLHAPFPDGKPIGLAIGVSNQWYSYRLRLCKDHLEFLLGEDSIHKHGIGKTEVLYDDKGYPDAIYFDGLNVDPTILVNFLRTMSSSYETDTIKSYMDAGLTRKEAMVINRINGGTNLANGYAGVGYNSVRRIYRSSPHDFSGGTMEQRVDYNRPMQDLIFQTKDAKEWWGNLCEKVGIPKLASRQINMQSVIIPKFREIIKIVEEREDDISRRKHIWKTSDGKITNETEGWVVP